MWWETNQSKWLSFCLSSCKPCCFLGLENRIMQPHGPGPCPLGWDVAHPSMLPRRGATWTLFRSAIYIYIYI
jgi:hypothetical protein